MLAGDTLLAARRRGGAAGSSEGEVGEGRVQAKERGRRRPSVGQKTAVSVAKTSSRSRQKLFSNRGRMTSSVAIPEHLVIRSVRALFTQSDVVWSCDYLHQSSAPLWTLAEGRGSERDGGILLQHTFK